jgi:hypothetical protein
MLQKANLTVISQERPEGSEFQPAVRHILEAFRVEDFNSVQSLQAD